MKRIALKAILFFMGNRHADSFQHLLKEILKQVQNDERGKHQHEKDIKPFI